MQGRSHLEAPPSPKVLPQKKKKILKKIKKIKILPQNLLFFLILAPPNFFFSIWPPQLGGAGSAPGDVRSRSEPERVPEKSMNPQPTD
jgi:hypothetical protein